MLNKRILTLVFVVAFVTLLVGCIPSQAPIITSDPVKTGEVGVPYTYNVNATDPDGDTLTYTLDVKPTNMSISSTTGLINWIPTTEGDFSVVVKVSDGTFDITQSFTITVIGEEEPGVTPTPVQYYAITATAGHGGSIDPSGKVIVEEGKDKTFTITPDAPFYYIADVLVDGISKGAVASYTFNNVIKWHTIHVTFRYSFTHTQDVNDGTVGQLVTTVAEDDDWMIWTFDFPVEQFTGDGNLNVGLIVALDGEGQGPKFQIHNNDGADSSYPWGTWLISPWGPTIGTGYFGWHSGDTNTPVTSLSWVSATGNRNVPHGDGVMQIRIKKSALGNTFYWAASPTVGTGFWAPASDITMQIPTAFGWSTPIVDMNVPNYIVR